MRKLFIMVILLALLFISSCSYQNKYSTVTKPITEANFLITEVSVKNTDATTKATTITTTTTSSTVNTTALTTNTTSSTVATEATVIPAVPSSIIDIRNEKLEYSFLGEYTQGMCMSEKYIFLSFSIYNGNTYRIRKIDRETGMIVAESKEYFNHANGLAYNPHTNELAICSLNGYSSATETYGMEDYGFYICDADTLALRRIVNIYDAVVNISPDLCAISGISYDVELRQYLVLTKYPSRNIIYLNDDLTVYKSLFLGSNVDLEGLYGDITTDTEYVYTCNWLSHKDRLLNEIDVYTLYGKHVYRYTIYGITHIESIDIKDGYCYANFIDFSSGTDIKGYSFKLTH